jgi:hypothetical protein
MWIDVSSQEMAIRKSHGSDKVPWQPQRPPIVPVEASVRGPKKKRGAVATATLQQQTGV